MFAVVVVGTFLLGVFLVELAKTWRRETAYRRSRVDENLEDWAPMSSSPIRQQRATPADRPVARVQSARDTLQGRIQQEIESLRREVDVLQKLIHAEGGREVFPHAFKTGLAHDHAPADEGKDARARQRNG